MNTDTLETVRERIRVAWSSRRACGLVSSACAIRIDRLIARRDAGLDDGHALLRQALEAEAVALCLPPVRAPEARRVSL